ncbi:hypothetical protein NKY66_00030 [Sinorhizobium meliloti]|uniref:hypothetical protein n=1 Tax=Rhizobium meliloti TaxID=382 RepID=UPI003D6588A9
MTRVEARPLSREQFVIWMAAALSGAPVQPQDLTKVTPRSADVVLVWPVDDRGARPVVCVARNKFQDFYAFVSTYFANVQPYTAYFRVVPLELLGNLEQEGVEHPRSIEVTKLVAGASIAEAWLAALRNGERPNNVLPLVRSTLSSALGQTVLAGYDSMALDWVLNEWLTIRAARNDAVVSSVEAISNVWSHVHAAIVPMERQRTSGLNASIIDFLATALKTRTINGEALRLISGDVAPNADLRSMLTASREERVGRFNVFISELKERGRLDVAAEFTAGLMLAIAGNGSFEMIRSAREFQGWLDGAATWFGICAALFDESNLMSYAHSVGRRMTRDLSRQPEIFGVVGADVASTELRFIQSSKGDVANLALTSAGSLEVEILPNVLSRLVLQDAGQSNQRAEEYEVMLSALDEISRVTDRARKRLRRSGQEDQSTSEDRLQRRPKKLF